MNFFETMMQFESRTMLGILFWCNIFLAAMVFTFETTTITTPDREYIRKAALVRLGFSTAYFLMIWGGVFPDIVSVNVGITALIFCFYLDARLMLSFSSAANKRNITILRIMLAIGIVLFNSLELIFVNDVIRGIAVSSVILVIYGVPTVSFLVNRRNSRFKHAVGGFYILFLISLFPRIVIPFTEMGIAASENPIALSGFFLVLVIITVCGTMSTLLFIKEKSDMLLESMALNDQLTQIPNRHCFFINANPLFDKCQREKRELSVLYTDIDYFKKINDTYGHDFGDVVLKRFAAVIKESVRKYDLYCRYGGEEFLIAAECDKSVMESLALRIMERLKIECFDEHPDFRFTISVGINASVPADHETLDIFINNADAALYEAKNGGRNTVRFHEAVMA